MAKKTEREVLLERLLIGLCKSIWEVTYSGSESDLDEIAERAENEAGIQDEVTQEIAWLRIGNHCFFRTTDSSPEYKVHNGLVVKIVGIADGTERETRCMFQVECRGVKFHAFADELESAHAEVAQA